MSPARSWLRQWQGQQGPQPEQHPVGLLKRDLLGRAVRSETTADVIQKYSKRRAVQYGMIMNDIIIYIYTIWLFNIAMEHHHFL